MAHKRKDTLTAPRQWWKHLREWKRVQNKQERRAWRGNLKMSNEQIDNET